MAVDTCEAWQITWVESHCLWVVIYWVTLWVITYRWLSRSRDMSFFNSQMTQFLKLSLISVSDRANVSGPVKINHAKCKINYASAKISQPFQLLYHNLIMIYIAILLTKSLLLTQNSMGFLCNLQKQDIAFKTKDIGKNITSCNLLLHGLLLKAWLHVYFKLTRFINCFIVHWYSKVLQNKPW